MVWFTRPESVFSFLTEDPTFPEPRASPSMFRLIVVTRVPWRVTTFSTLALATGRSVLVSIDWSYPPSSFFFDVTEVIVPPDAAGT